MDHLCHSTHPAARDLALKGHGRVREGAVRPWPGPSPLSLHSLIYRGDSEDSHPSVVGRIFCTAVITILPAWWSNSPLRLEGGVALQVECFVANKPPLGPRAAWSWGGRWVGEGCLRKTGTVVRVLCATSPWAWAAGGLPVWWTWL